MMRRIIGKLLFLAAIVSVMTACGKDDGNDVIWDIVPWNITMEVSGHDLSGANVVTATWGDKTYVLNADIQLTRAIATVFEGLHTNNGKLVFGELSSTKKYESEQLIIDWGDGSQPDTITFSHELYWIAGLPDFNQQFLLNGKPVNLPIVINNKH